MLDIEQLDWKRLHRLGELPWREEKRHGMPASAPANDGGTECIQFGNLVMEGRDIGTNVFPETDYKFYLDACLNERTKRRHADGVQENLAERDHRDSQRAAAPLMVALGAMVINNSGMTAEETSAIIIAEVQKRLAAFQPEHS